jgi:two-component system phosphate regulon sensor histidine kinase PhoR
MKHKSVTGSLYRFTVILIVLALSAASLTVALRFRNFTYRQEAEEFEDRLRLIEEDFLRLFPADSEEAVVRIDRLSKELGEREQLRLTVIRPDGIVVGDTYFDPASLVNHANRVEMREALGGSTGVSARYSDSADQRMLYVAVPMTVSQEIVGVLRASVPISAVNARLRDLWLRSLPLLFGMLVASALVLWFAFARVRHGFGRLNAEAGSLQTRNYDAGLVDPGWVETQGLTETIGSMARQLSERMNTVDRQQSQEKAILASMIEAVLAIDSNQRVITMNEAAADLLGIPVGEALGTRIEEAVRLGGILEFIQRAVDSSTPIVENLRIYGEEGERYLRAHGTRLVDGMGEDLGALVVLYDITRLQKLELVRKEFAANVSHELKTPITSIKGFVETLLDDKLNDRGETERFLKIIAQQTERLNAIVDDLLSLARLEQSIEREEVRLSPNRLHPVLEAAVAVCSKSAAAKAIALRLECSPSLEAECNPQLLEQAVVNLIDNAVKYSDNESEVRIKATLRSGKIEVSVEDQGCGIEDQHLPRLFERFYRVDKARSRELGGTGLGLAIVKHIALSHQGQVDVKSSPGVGSTFYIRFPRHGQLA